MRMTTRAFSAPAILALSLSLALTACTNSEKKADPTTAPPSSDTAAEPGPGLKPLPPGGAPTIAAPSPTQQPTTPSSARTPGTTLSILDLQVGDCVDTDGGSNVSELTLRDCNEAHMFEVYAISVINKDTLPAGADMDQEVTDACDPTFESYVGISYANSATYDISYLVPTDTSWRFGNRSIKCMLSARDGSSTLTGSGKDTAR